MCLTPDLPKDNSAAIARRQSDRRERMIGRGKERIDNAFGVFTPEYFEQFKGDYLDYYNPQVDEQFTDARQKLRYNLARARTQDSTGGQKAFGDLVEGYEDRRRDIAAQALEATNKIRGQVEQNKGDLYNLNTAAADPSLAAIQAVGRAGSLQSPPAFSPLGDLFSGLVNAGSGYFAGRNQGLPMGYSRYFQPGGTLPGGSGYTVR